MAGSTIDHLVSLTIFLAALLLFINLFNQTIQTAISYQRNRNLATKCSDLLDNMLLNPGIPSYWGKSNCTLTGFGLQDPEFTQYKLSPFSLMRLRSSTGEPIYYSKTGLTYSNITMGFGNFLLVPYTEVINYTTVQALLGVNNTHGFQLTITPIITVSVSEVQSENPLKISVKVAGTGFPLSNAMVSYCFLRVSLGGAYPAYTTDYSADYTDDEGLVIFEFPDVYSDDSYAFVAYAHLSGLIGVGYHERVTSDEQYVIPLVDNLEEQRVLIAHSYDVHQSGSPSELTYNATFVLLTEDFTLREMPLENSTGKVVHGQGYPYGVITIPTYNPGILIITYKWNVQEGGVVLMPWGISSMAFPVTFGEDPLEPFSKNWVVTDIRQVTVSNIAYQAKLALWSIEGYQVVS
jgi:hypothetical protein